jgi:hypothetical protein
MKTITNKGKNASEENAVAEWIHCGLLTKKHEQGWLHPSFGIDIVSVMSSANPESTIEQNIREMCSLRNDISSITTYFTRNENKMDVSIEIETRYGKTYVTESIYI